MKWWLYGDNFWLRSYETSQTETQNSDGQTETTGQQSETSGGQSGFLSRDEFDRFRAEIGEQFSGIGAKVDEGFTWLREQASNQTTQTESTEQNPPEPEGGQESESVTLQVQDRQTVRNKKPRTRLNFPNLFRK